MKCPRKFTDYYSKLTSLQLRENLSSKSQSNLDIKLKLIKKYKLVSIYTKCPNYRRYHAMKVVWKVSTVDLVFDHQPEFKSAFFPTISLERCLFYIKNVENIQKVKIKCLKGIK